MVIHAAFFLAIILLYGIISLIQILLEPRRSMRQWYELHRNLHESIHVEITSDPLHYDHDPDDNYQGEVASDTKYSWKQYGF